MHRREPSPLATWMLEHLTSGERDEALAGDLLEEYRSGRSDGWYWRQVLVACVVSWSRSLAARGPAIVFALLWCIPAPAWKQIVLRATNSQVLNGTWNVLGPFWLLLALAGWTILHASFLWAGLLVYQLAYVILGKKLRQRDLRRAFWITTLVLPPVMGITFVLVSLYQYSIPGLAHARLANTSLGQIVDFGLLPDVIRIPYFVALLCALWGTIHPSRLTQARRAQTNHPTDPVAEGVAPLSDTIVAATRDTFVVKRFLGFMVAAGLVNSTIAAILLCRLPDTHTPTLGSLLIRAACFVAVGVAAGAMGAYAYWEGPWSPFRDQPLIPFPLFALACASGWVWVPAMILFSGALSAGAAFVAMIGAYALAGGLRNAMYIVFATTPRGSPSVARSRMDLFEESLYCTPADLSGYAIAISLVVAGAALAARSTFTAGTFLAYAAALFAWKKTVPRDRSFENRREYRQAALRVALVLLPAVLVTAWALLDGVAYRNRIAGTGAGFAAENSSLADAGNKRASSSRTIAYGAGGFESVVLWPYPPKKQIIPPIPMSDRILAPGTSQPLIIHFDGPYRYVQPPDKLPGRDAHQAHGTPLDVDIESNNFLPVVMTAHQSLPAAIRVARCREIDVEIENRDNLAGPISLALLLTDSGSAGKPTLYLGQQPIDSTEPGYFSFKASPLHETLHFSIPASARVKMFSEITVMVLPDIEHRFVAPKIAIQQFQLFPR
jgi:hypothetical protein